MPRLMEISTPLGPGELLFLRMHAREDVSRMFEYEIDLLSKKGDIDPDKILAKAVTVKLELPERKKRFFNGYVTRFAQVGMHGRFHLYRAMVRPWLWFLNRGANCRIFQELTVPEILKKVFDECSIQNVKLDGLTATYAKRDYCVQYRESDFNFVSRLMEDEGIYYFFQHADGKHKMVLADSYSAHTPFEGYAKIPFSGLERATRAEKEYIHQWSFEREVQPGKFVLDDYDFEKPKTELMVKTNQKRGHELADFEVYDYPGGYVKTGEGDHYVRTRMEEAHYQFEIAQAQSNARGLSVGYLFDLTGHPRTDQNREYLVLSGEYELEFTEYESMETQGARYQCSFTALNSRQAFRPRRSTRKPFVQGPQTAVVVGPSGDEIYTDKYGRVKLQFHWDRLGKNDENSSCWTRVSHPWAGKNWGMVAIPRIGQEVVVDFLEGDPDRPLITGRVYNADQMPPWDLPANKTQTGILTRSSKGGSGANANAIRFEDKKGSEQLWIHAEKNQDIEVENDETHWVGHDRKKTVDNDENVEVKNNRTEKVGSNEKITIGASRTESVGTDETIDVGANRTETVGANEDITIGANRSVSVGASETITIGASQSVTVGASRTDTVGASMTQSIGASLTQTIGGSWSVTAGGPVTITAPAGLAIVSPGGNRTVDFLFDKIGGILKDTFGMEHSNFGAKYENGGLFIGMTGNKLEHAAMAVNFKGMLLETKGINLKDIGTVVDKGSLTAWLKGFVTFA